MSTLREELLSSQESILLLSYTNRAVDEICSKLVESGIGFVRIGSRLSCGEPFRQFLLDAVVDGAANVSQLRSRISAVRVVVGTTASLNSNIEIFQLKHFSLAVIDEASQILEPQLMGLLAAVHGQRPAIDRFVMIGDHKQLPAVVQQTDAQSRVEQRELQQIELTDCRSSLFERLLRRYGDDPRVVYMLSHQGRMHPSIAGFPNQAFYESKLSAVPLAHQLTAEDALLASGSSSLMMPEVFDSRLKFLSVQPQSIAESDKVNIDEAQVIARYVVDVYRSNRSRFDAGQTVGVIVPYRNQIATVRAAIGSYGIAELDAVSIDTVERFQGSQRDYIAYGFTVRYHYQLSFLEGSVFTEGTVPIDRKLNVAMTRARKHLLIVGNAPLLSTLPVYRNLIEYMKQQGNFIA
jgi:superfamily I DNA and/or RNA helicase